MSDDRNTLPGSPPTDEDLRHEVELTRQELSGTLARILYKADVPARARDAMHTKVDQAKVTAERVRRSPIALGGVFVGMAALLAGLWFWLRR